VTNTVPAGAITARVRCIVELTANDGIGEAWFDAIKLERGDIPTAWTTGMIGHVTIDSNRVQVQDSNAKVWLGQRGSSLGMWGEDAAGNLEVGWYASGTNAGYIVAGGGDVLIGSEGITLAEGTAFNRAELSWDDGTYWLSLSAILTASEQGMQIVNTQGDGSQYIWIDPCDPGDSDIGRISVETFSPPYIGELKIVASPLYLAGTAGVKVLVNETANADMSTGITINQGASDDQALAFKSSDVAHGMTDELETDTYGVLQKQSGAYGGLATFGITEASIAQELIGYYTTDDTNKDATAKAPVVVTVRKKDSASVGAPGADANLFAVRLGANATRFLVDEDGDIYYDGSASSYHEHDDLALIRELQAVLTGEMRTAGISRVRELGFVGQTINGSTLVSQKRRASLVEGALLQLDARIRRLEESA